MAESDDLRDQGGRKYVRRHGRLQDIKEAIASHTYSPEDLEKLGAQAYQEGDYDAASVYLQEASIARRDPTAMARFAELMEKAHEPDRAFKAYEFAVNQGIKSAVVVLRLVHAYEDRHMFEEAHRLASQFLANYPAAEEAKDFAEVKRRVETKLDLKRKLDSRRELLGSSAGRQGFAYTASTRSGEPVATSVTAPQARMAQWIEALKAGDRGLYLDCYLASARSAADSDWARLREVLSGAEDLSVDSATDDGEQVAVRGRLRRSKGDLAFNATLGRIGSHCLIDRVDVPASSSGT